MGDSGLKSIQMRHGSEDHHGLEGATANLCESRAKLHGLSRRPSLTLSQNAQTALIFTVAIFTKVRLDEFEVVYAANIEPVSAVPAGALKGMHAPLS